jgi:NAD(P)-dependent dehydrogenase (short-subunit alcohol dehydrogenase family)
MNVEPKPLAGKIALVTGASRGIGTAIAERLAALGADVAVTGRNAPQLAKVAAALGKAGARVFSVSGDLTKADAAASVVAQTEQALGPIDILVNNAGVGWFKPIQDFSETDWNTILDTNLKAVFLLTKAAAPGMIRRRTGHIINIASLAGKNAFPGGSVYCASKWGLLGLTQCAAEELRGHGIRVAAICPGTVATDFSPHAGKDPAKMLQSEDIAHAVETLVTQSPQSFISEILLRPTQKP